ncbi:MAG: Ppx/GppA phosphatase family protein [Capsulimonas sp.]|uniref:Ppx/GppA phosphatase family protein n=1 Tax=Capsulimonas sp. TaxID=2494211 RepID=UPI0032635F9B
MSTRIAAIDVGTNSTKATLADADRGAITIVREDSEVTRLGEGVDASGTLKPAAMDRTLTAIKRFADAAREGGATRIVAAGTSAMRDASNGPEFIQRISQEAGVQIEIITGDREAELAYQAIRSDSSLGLAPDLALLVFDIGGGSSELIVGEGSAVRAHQSLNIGAVRLTERFLHGDPPTPAELDQASQYVVDKMEEFPLSPAPKAIAGIGGTAINVAAVAAHAAGNGDAEIHGASVTLAQVDSVLELFTSRTTTERKSVPGLESARADVIIGGVLILRELLRRANVDRFVVSQRGLRYGLIAEAARLAGD